MTPSRMLTLLLALAVLAIALFMTVGVRGKWEFVLPFRAGKVAAMVLVGYAVAVSTVLFQTVTNNRILTPSIMGFDALYILIQTMMVFIFSAGGFARIDAQLKFAIEIVAMVAFSGVLFRWLFLDKGRSIHLLVLAGIVFGVLFRSLSNFMQRLLDPNAFAVLQDTFFASFNSIDQSLLVTAAIFVGAVSVVGLRMLTVFDVLALGRDHAVNLGVAHRRVVSIVLVMVSILVSVSTALAGPVTFFGLLVANLAYALIGSHKHIHILPAAILLSVIALVGGQAVLERVFAFDTALSIVIEFVGGLTFIFLLLRGHAR